MHRFARAYFRDPARFRFLETNGLLSTADGLVGYGDVANAAAQLACGRGGQAAAARVAMSEAARTDADADGDVDRDDVTHVAALLGLCQGDAAFDAVADLNGDGCVTALDLGVIDALAPFPVDAADDVPGEVSDLDDLTGGQQSGTCNGDAGFDPDADRDGDGCVTALDLE